MTFLWILSYINIYIWLWLRLLLLLHEIENKKNHWNSLTDEIVLKYKCKRLYYELIFFLLLEMFLMFHLDFFVDCLSELFCWILAIAFSFPSFFFLYIYFYYLISINCIERLKDTLNSYPLSPFLLFFEKEMLIYFNACGKMLNMNRNQCPFLIREKYTFRQFLIILAFFSFFFFSFHFV